MSFTERQEGPDGQFCELYTRFTYDEMQRIEEASVSRMNISAFADAVLKVAASEFMVFHARTGKENTTDIGVGNAAVTVPWRDRAVDLYLAWKEEAFPKDESEDDASPPAETSASAS